jgi:hypothetical protein
MNCDEGRTESINLAEGFHSRLRASFLHRDCFDQHRKRSLRLAGFRDGDNLGSITAWQKKGP